MKKWWMKACPKCGGDLFEDVYLGDREIKCLQCGKALPRDQEVLMRTRPAVDRRAPAIRRAA